jgi:hypothetical protein
LLFDHQSFQNQDPVDIQVVGRLIEQQQVGLLREGEGERCALAFAAGSGFRVCIRIYVESVQELVELVFFRCVRSGQQGFLNTGRR